MAEQMSQEEIDSLLQTISAGNIDGGDFDEKTLLRDNDKLRKLIKDAESARERYIFALISGKRPYEVACAAKYLKQAGHRIWLETNGFKSRSDFLFWMKQNICWDAYQQRWIKKPHAA
jgi:hypothetical protein